ncbi:DUF3152 domain-containing protein [Krasilnikovia cinnamomea]|uniref:DUF3152 domain-containing protein n=1 Tax=Krasilnikovia cinnamomea TaxID=349313 RepID=UPI001F5F0401|nr:DUF3152 domain-containing protein [Krasilnikovia cinnamomea]
MNPAADPPAALRADEDGAPERAVLEHSARAIAANRPSPRASVTAEVPDEAPERRPRRRRGAADAASADASAPHRRVENPIEDALAWVTEPRPRRRRLGEGESGRRRRSGTALPSGDDAPPTSGGPPGPSAASPYAQEAARPRRRRSGAGFPSDVAAAEQRRGATDPAESADGGWGATAPGRSGEPQEAESGEAGRPVSSRSRRRRMQTDEGGGAAWGGLSGEGPGEARKGRGRPRRGSAAGAPESTPAPTGARRRSTVDDLDAQRSAIAARAAARRRPTAAAAARATAPGAVSQRPGTGPLTPELAAVLHRTQEAVNRAAMTDRTTAHRPHPAEVHEVPPAPEVHDVREAQTAAENDVAAWVDMLIGTVNRTEESQPASLWPDGPEADDDTVRGDTVVGETGWDLPDIVGLADAREHFWPPIVVGPAPAEPMVAEPTAAETGARDVAEPPAAEAQARVVPGVTGATGADARDTDTAMRAEPLTPDADASIAAEPLTPDADASIAAEPLTPDAATAEAEAEAETGAAAEALTPDAETAEALTPDTATAEAEPLAAGTSAAAEARTPDAATAEAETLDTDASIAAESAVGAARADAAAAQEPAPADADTVEVTRSQREAATAGHVAAAGAAATAGTTTSPPDSEPLPPGPVEAVHPGDLSTAPGGRSAGAVGLATAPHAAPDEGPILLPGVAGAPPDEGAAPAEGPGGDRRRLRAALLALLTVAVLIAGIIWLVRRDPMAARRTVGHTPSAAPITPQEQPQGTGPTAGAAPAPVPTTAAPTTAAPTTAVPTTAAPTPTSGAGAAPPPDEAQQAPSGSGPAGTFKYATGYGPVLGTKGTMRTFHVAVEKYLGQGDGALVDTGPDASAFAADVDDILGDPRSWVAGGKVRFQRAPHGQPAEFTVYLASPDTSEEMCARGGLDTKGFSSCRLPGQVVINSERWRKAVPHYDAPLDVYRAYVINHEVGHQLGHGHEKCPGKGKPAPVMLRQTYSLDGCTAYGWPYRNGKRYAGPPAV